ncbi:hypothetical protein [Catellatospora sichuanensis]|uniref:hypothetical protein n=1 Tax=Catellatospora sichuanensis TaxID=1969805 RepID=UPI0011834F6B|nr:hypothetical protein [Catellatospora sichuanensis]
MAIAETATAVTEIEPPGTVGRSLRRVSVAGTLLGALAFLGDELPGVGGRIVLTLTSNGFAWGAAALVAGYLVRQARRAPFVATGLLLVATAIYYLLILVVSRRWSGGYTEDGSSYDVYGLLDLARAAGFWLVLAVGAGLVLGLLGHIVRNGSPRLAAAAAGSAFGLLTAEGLHGVITAPWTVITEPFHLAYAVSHGVQVLLAVVLVIILTARRGGPVSWRICAASAVFVAALGVTAWSVIESIRVSGF